MGVGGAGGKKSQQICIHGMIKFIYCKLSVYQYTWKCFLFVLLIIFDRLLFSVKITLHVWSRKRDRKDWHTIIFHHLSLNREGRWGTTDDFTTRFLHFSPFSTALWDLANSWPVHSLMLSSHLFLCLPCLLPPFTVTCKTFLARPDELETWPYYWSLHLFTLFRRSLCGPIACWILAWTSSLVTWSLYEMHSILR